jgi:hypothetical protein
VDIAQSTEPLPREPGPTEIVIRETVRLAALMGKYHYADLQRSLEHSLEQMRKEKGLTPGNTPDTRKIKWIINEHVNKLPAEVFMSEFPLKQ